MGKEDGGKETLFSDLQGKRCELSKQGWENSHHPFQTNKQTSWDSVALGFIVCVYNASMMKVFCYSTVRDEF